MSSVLNELQPYIGKVLEIEDNRKLYLGQIQQIEIIAHGFLKITFSQLITKEGAFGWIGTTANAYAIFVDRIKWSRNADKKITGFQYDQQTCRFLEPSAMQIV